MISIFLKPTNKTAQIIFLTVMLKLFSYELNLKKLLSTKKLINSFLVDNDNCQKRIASAENLRSNLQQETPTKIWIRKENIFKSVFKTSSILNLEQLEYQNIEGESLSKTGFTSKSLIASFEEEMIDSFIEHISSPTPLHGELINNATKLYKKRTITIISSFPISKQKRQYLITILREKVATTAKIKFQIKKYIIDKIELHDRGYMISWDSHNYITELRV